MATRSGVYLIVMITKILSFVRQYLMLQDSYRIAFSNPSFEYWYLLHFEKYVGFLKDSAAVVNILKSRDYLKRYAKNIDVFRELSERQSGAIRNAGERKEELTRNGGPVICRGSNPVTTVYELVDFLNSRTTV